VAEPGHLTANPFISAKGRGKPGYCSLCALLDPKVQKGLTQLYREGRKTPLINDWLEANVGKRWDRRVITAHGKDHISHPRDRIVSAVERRQSQGTLPANVSEDDFQRAVVAAAHQRLLDEPDAITIDQGLKAAAAMQAAKQSRQSGINVLVMTLTRGLDSTPMLLRSGEDAIEGEVVEI